MWVIEGSVLNNSLPLYPSDAACYLLLSRVVTVSLSITSGAEVGVTLRSGSLHGSDYFRFGFVIFYRQSI